ncbi:C-type lectin domain-containing protein [bacterium 1XD21-13]|nr:C-type lectin domain-containing protein [bacterium 1XD21-13]
MKRQKLVFLWGMLCLFLMACGKSDANTMPDDKAKEKQQQSSHTKEEDNSDNGEASGTEGAEEDSSDIELWEQAYLDYLEGFEMGDSCTYSLIYVDEDEIPELVIDSGVEAGGCQILTWHEEGMDVLQTSRLYFTYIEKGNLLCNSEGNMGYYYDNVYTIKDGFWEFVGGGTYSDPPDGPKFDENDDYIFEYHWLQQPVEKSEYEQKLHAIYPEKQGKLPEVYYIKDEMCSVLRTKETTAVKHRYELIVEDLTWTQAQEACEKKGGCLATLTSREEFERVQEQIISEEKTGVTFFVGANRVDRFGFGWLEPGKPEGYSMLDLYNALFAGFWLEGEPSYEGLTEDGREVREEYVAILYRSADGRCYLNDVPGDILGAAPSYAGRIGYVCEYNHDTASGD